MSVSEDPCSKTFAGVHDILVSSSQAASQHHMAFLRAQMAAWCRFQPENIIVLHDEQPHPEYWPTKVRRDACLCATDHQRSAALLWGGFRPACGR